DRARCAAGRRNPKPARHLRAPRRRSLHLPRRRAPTHRSASPVAGSAAHAAAVEGALRERAAAIPAPSRPAVEIPPRDSLVVLCRWGKDAEVWPLTIDLQGPPFPDPRLRVVDPAFLAGSEQARNLGFLSGQRTLGAAMGRGRLGSRIDHEVTRVFI